MSKLLKQLRASVAVDEQALQTALRRQQIYGGSLDTVLLELDLIDPPTLDRELALANECEPAPVSLLAPGPERPWNALPKSLLDLGWAMPLRQHMGSVQVVIHPEIPVIDNISYLVGDDEHPVRLMHPRWPLYVIPRDGNRFMIGATSIEREDDGVTVRSALELLSAAYAVHPAFAEARIVEIGSGLRPAFPDNMPRITIEGSRIAVNGLYRHGFLLAPALAELTLNYLTRGALDNEVMRCA